jgi:hypothetical protein
MEKDGIDVGGSEFYGFVGSIRKKPSKARNEYQSSENGWQQVIGKSMGGILWWLLLLFGHGFPPQDFQIETGIGDLSLPSIH